MPALDAPTCAWLLRLPARHDIFASSSAARAETVREIGLTLGTEREQPVDAQI